MSISSIVMGVPFITPPNPAKVPGWNRMRSLLIGWDGVTWDMTNPDMGVFHTREGIRGLGVGKFTHQRDQSPATPGSMYRGTTYQARPCFWPVYLFHDGSSKEFVARDRAWHHSLHPEHLSQWCIEVPGVSRRYLDIRLESDSDWAPEGDPTFYGWASYGVELQADQPFWYEDATSYRFDAVTPLPFFGGTDDGDPIINITSGRSLSTAAVRNPGDVPAYPLVTLYGPFTSAEVTVGGKVIEIPFAVADGKSLILDYRPRYRTAINSDGVDKFSSLGAVAWGSLASGSSVPIGLTITGAGYAVVDVTPLYLKPW